MKNDFIISIIFLDVRKKYFQNILKDADLGYNIHRAVPNNE